MLDTVVQVVTCHWMECVSLTRDLLLEGCVTRYSIVVFVIRPLICPSFSLPFPPRLLLILSPLLQPFDCTLEERGEGSKRKKRANERVENEWNKGRNEGKGRTQNPFLLMNDVQEREEIGKREDVTYHLLGSFLIQEFLSKPPIFMYRLVLKCDGSHSFGVMWFYCSTLPALCPMSVWFSRYCSRTLSR